MRYFHPAVIAAGLLAGLGPVSGAHVARAAARSTLIGKSYCNSDQTGTQRFIFTRQAGDKLLGSITGYDTSNRQVWTFPLRTSPAPNGAVATINGDQLFVRFHSPAGAPTGRDELVVNPANDTFSGTNYTSQGNGNVTYNRC